MQPFIKIVERRSTLASCLAAHLKAAADLRHASVLPAGAPRGTPLPGTWRHRGLLLRSALAGYIIIFVIPRLYLFIYNTKERDPETSRRP